MKHPPFDPSAPADSPDGWIRDNWPDHVEFLLKTLGSRSRKWVPKRYRSIAAKALRNTDPTGLPPGPSRDRRARIVAALMERDGPNPDCHVCGASLFSEAVAEIDHVWPLIKNGRHCLDNMGLAHSWCNDLKRTRTDLSQAEARAKLLERLPDHWHPQWKADLEALHRA